MQTGCNPAYLIFTVFKNKKESITLSTEAVIPLHSAGLNLLKKTYFNQQFKSLHRAEVTLELRHSSQPLTALKASKEEMPRSEPGLPGGSTVEDLCFPFHKRRPNLEIKKEQYFS